MTLMTITTIDAKEEFSELVNRVSLNKERVVLTRRGKEVAAIIPIEDLVLLQQSQNESDLLESVEALKESRTAGSVTLEALKEELLKS